MGEIVKAAWLKIPEKGTPLGSFANLRQGPTEDYMSFINKLQRVIEWQVENTEAADILMKQLVFENANMDCKMALQAIYNKPETDIAAM